MLEHVSQRGGSHIFAQASKGFCYPFVQFPPTMAFARIRILQ